MDEVDDGASTKEERRGALPARALPGASSSTATATTASRSSRSLAFAELTGAEHVLLEGAGHLPMARHPVIVNRLIREFAERVDPPAPRQPRACGEARGRRALLVSSPIGLGHAWRDIAIARELRKLHPGLEVQWLAQHPVTTVLEAQGRAHPPGQCRARPRGGSRRRRGRRARAERLPDAAPAGRDLLRELHGLPRRRARRALRPLDRRRGLGGRLLPAREPGAEDRALRLAHRLRRHAADARGRRARGVPRGRPQRADGRARRRAIRGLRDRAIFIGDPADVVDEPLGPGLPEIRAWTRDHFGVRRLRHRLRPRPRSPTARRCAPSSATASTRRSASSPSAARPSATHLLERAAAPSRWRGDACRGCGWSSSRGPRIDPARSHTATASRRSATCTGSTATWRPATSRSATAACPRRWSSPPPAGPSCPSRCASHFEQNRHVAHRLRRHGAGRQDELRDRWAVRDRGGHGGGDRPGHELPGGRLRRRGARRAHDRRAALGARARRVREHRDEIAQEVVDVLDPDREADQVVRHLEARARRARRASSRRGARSGSRRRRGSRPASTRPSRPAPRRRPARPPCTRNAIMPPKRRICRFASRGPGGSRGRGRRPR